MTIWIENDGYEPVGTIGFLVLIAPERGDGRHYLSDRPPYTNMSREPRLTGWCGTTNNVARFGCGMARITRCARNGRALVTRLHGRELTAALDQFGFPELDPASD